MSEDKQKNDANIPLFPLLEIFGSAYGALIIVLVIMNLMLRFVAEKMNNPENIGGIAETAIGKSTGYVISLFPDRLRIEKNGQEVTFEELKKEKNPFRKFSKENFTGESANIPLFFIYPGCNNVFLKAELILAKLEVKRLKILIINKEMIMKLKILNRKGIWKNEKKEQKE